MLHTNDVNLISFLSNSNMIKQNHVSCTKDVVNLIMLNE